MLRRFASAARLGADAVAHLVAFIAVTGFGGGLTPPAPLAQPQFHDYPAPKTLISRPAAPRIVSRRDRQFRSVIMEASRAGPDFAGHFKVAVWGCGMGCVEFAIVDGLDGTVYDPPISAFAAGDDKGFVKDFGVHYRVDSRLLKVVGCPNEMDCAKRNYVIGRGGLVLLSRQPADRATRSR